MDLGAPPEDDPGTPGEGALGTAIPPQLSGETQRSERMQSLAARVDAMMGDDDEPARGEALDLDELEEVEDDVAEVAVAAARTQAPTPPPLPIRPSMPSVVMVPPRTPSTKPTGARPALP